MFDDDEHYPFDLIKKEDVYDGSISVDRSSRSKDSHSHFKVILCCSLPTKLDEKDLSKFLIFCKIKKKDWQNFAKKKKKRK